MRQKVKLALSLQDEPFFQGMSPEIMARIGGVVYHRKYEARQIVYFPDDPCDYVYWVRDGRVKVTRVSDDGRELAFRHVMPGDMLGEECLSKKSRRGNYAEAMQQTTLCLMRAEDFRQLVFEEIELARMVLKGLNQRVIDLEQVLAETVFNNVRSRIAACLLKLHRRQSGQHASVLHVTHQEIANLIGATRETTTATLHELRDEGMLEIANRRVVLRDINALERVSRNG